MQVTILHDFESLRRGKLLAGDVLDVQDGLAQRWIKRGHAVELPAEGAPAAPPETKILRRAPRRKKK